MRRITTAIVVFFLGMNAGAVLLDVTQIDVLLGIGAGTGGTGSFEQIAHTHQSIKTGDPSEQTLLTMYISATDTFSGILAGVFPGLAMLRNAGVPDYWIGFASQIIGLFMSLDIISFIRGYYT